MCCKYPIPSEKMEKICIDSEEFGIKDLVLDITVLTNDMYRSLTEVGIVDMLKEGVVNDFYRENDPTEVISFAGWQMEKLDKETAEYIWDYIYWSLEEEKPKHPYKDQWLKFLDELGTYIDNWGKKIAKRYEIKQVFPAACNKVYCLCSDGNFRIYDATKLVESGKGVFKYLEDPSFFRDRIGVINDTLAWDTTGDKNPYKCIDVNPEHIYKAGQLLEMDKAVAILDAVLTGKQISEEWLKNILNEEECN